MAAKRQFGAWFGSVVALAGAASCQLLLPEDFAHPCEGVPAGVACPASSGAGGGTSTSTSTSSTGTGKGCSSADECPSGLHGEATCKAGRCGFDCAAGFDDCDEEIGCETPTSTDKNNCGGCKKTCSAYCVGGSCNDPVFISAGLVSTCAVMSQGDVYCWGRNQSGQLGDGTITDRNVPTRVSQLGPAVEVSTNGYLIPDLRAHTCAVLVSGDVACWGSNDFLALGNGGPNDSTSVAPVTLGLTQMAHVSAGGYHTCALSHGGDLSCWGGNSLGQVGNNSAVDVGLPTQIKTQVVSASCGAQHSCAADAFGNTTCWGYNEDGELGNGSTSNRASPFPVSASAGSDVSGVAQVAAGAVSTCAISAAGPFCWGSNSVGQLGIGAGPTNALAATPLVLQGATQVEVGNNAAGALVAGAVWMWGDNTLGILGNGTTTSSSTPQASGATAGATQLSVAVQHACALVGDRVLCWGANDFGQLGDGTTTGSLSPVPVVWP